MGVGVQSKAFVTEDLAEATSLVQELIGRNEIVIFSKTYCPYCKMAKECFPPPPVVKYLSHHLDQLLTQKKATWPYGSMMLQGFWDSASLSKVEMLEQFQSQTLHLLTQIPRFVSNALICSDLGIPQVVKEVIRHQAIYTTNRLDTHPYPLAHALLSVGTWSLSPISNILYSSHQQMSAASDSSRLMGVKNKRYKKAFDALQKKYTVIELDQRSDGSAIQTVLGQMTGVRTVPRVFVNGRCIGGGNEIKLLYESGSLMSMLK